MGFVELEPKPVIAHAVTRVTIQTGPDTWELETRVMDLHMDTTVDEIVEWAYGHSANSPRGTYRTSVEIAMQPEGG